MKRKETMNNKASVFEAPFKVALRDETIELKPGKGEMLVENQYSLISTGTELAYLSDRETSFCLPGVPGYCCVSKVIEAGEDSLLPAGAYVFHYGAHQRFQLISANPYNLMIPVPEGVDLKLVPMLRMATVAFTAIRVSDIELGDVVLVSGQGLVGIMAAQLAKLSGAIVIGVDPAEKRRKLSLAVGTDYVADPSEAAALVHKVTSGTGVNTVIEATGVSAAAYNCLSMIGYHGEIILLGTPRDEFNTDLTQVLRYCHIDGQGSITFKGAHEWRYPLEEDRFVKHSITRNTKICLDLLKKDRLHMRELISHVLTPMEAADAYMAVYRDRNAYLGILIDWTK